MARRWYMVIALTILLGIAYIDRSAISLVADPIKADLKLSDTQLSLLVGASLSLFQLLVSIPMGMLVDRFNRKRLIMIGAVLWACATTTCGLAGNFWQLFVGRMGVGFSEGGLQPASFSIIRDTMPPESRGRAFGLYGTGLFIGGASALIFSGAILMLAERFGPFSLPLIGAVQPWQLVFLTIGLASLPFALLLVPAVEPPRGGLAPGAAAKVSSYGDVLRFIWRERSLFAPLLLFVSFYMMMSAGYAAWGPALAHRNYGLELSRVGLIMGVIVIVAPTAGLFLVGSAVDHLTRKGRRNGPAIVGLVVMLLAAAPQIFTPLMPTEFTFWASYSALMFFSGGVPPVAQVLLSRMTPSGLSGKVMAIYGIVQVLCGATVGPLLIGLASDNIFHGPRSLAHATVLNAAIFVFLIVLTAIWLIRATRDLPIDGEAVVDPAPGP